MARKPSPSQTRAAQAEQAGAPPRQNRMLRFLVLFPIFLAVGFCALLIPFLHPAITAFTRGLVEISAIVIRLFGGNAAAQQVVLQNPSNGFAMEVLDGCNGDDVAVLLWAAILAYPASWLQKGKGLWPAPRRFTSSTFCASSASSTWANITCGGSSSRTYMCGRACLCSSR